MKTLQLNIHEKPSFFIKRVIEKKKNHLLIEAREHPTRYQIQFTTFFRKDG